MGIHGLMPFVRAIVPEAIKTVHLTQLRATSDSGYNKNITICVDFNQFLFTYSYLYNKYNMKCPRALFIETKFQKLIEKFAAVNIELIFVMDGIPAANKKQTLEKRHERIKKFEDLIIADTTLEPQFKKKTTRIQHDDCTAMEYYFKCNRVRYIHHDNYEADLLCKWLVEYNYADYCLTNDSDLLAYGCRHILMNFNYSLNTFSYVNYANVLHHMHLSSTQFLDLCICCGTDFNAKYMLVDAMYQLLQVTDYTLDKVITNIAKLQYRYPNLFTDEVIINHDANIICDYIRTIFEQRIHKMSIELYLQKQRITIADLHVIECRSTTILGDYANVRGDEGALSGVTAPSMEWTHQE
jgi:5'-3' exonuclease